MSQLTDGDAQPDQGGHDVKRGTLRLTPTHFEILSARTKLTQVRLCYRLQLKPNTGMIPRAVDEIGEVATIARKHRYNA